MKPYKKKENKKRSEGTCPGSNEYYCIPAPINTSYFNGLKGANIAFFL